MIFAWGSATAQFHGGLNFGGGFIPRSPVIGDLPAQVFVQRFDPAGDPLDAQPSGLVYYVSNARAWAHQYPSLAAQRHDACQTCPEPPANFGPLPDPPPDYPPELAGYSNVAAAFTSDFSGFSKIAPSADSLVIYVCPDTGDDNNSGVWPRKSSDG